MSVINSLYTLLNQTIISILNIKAYIKKFDMKSDQAVLTA